MNHAIHPVEGEAEWEAVKRIRQVVFVEEQRCPPDEEWDEHDATARHVLLTVDGVPAGCARWRVATYDDHATAKLERFAVLPLYRARGLGRALVAWVVGDAEKAGFARQMLYAQAHLEGFYASFGFRRSGPDFWEAGILHTPMVRATSAPHITEIARDVEKPEPDTRTK